MAIQVDEFQLPVGRSESEEACLRALRGVEWEALASDRFEVPATVRGSDSEAIAWWLERLTRGRSLRYTTLSARAPEGPAQAEVEICAVWSARVVVRISLQERALAATDLTISASGIPGIANSMVRSAVGELRRSIEIQAGSTTPDRPPT